MKTTKPRRFTTSEDIAARVKQLTPRLLEGLAPAAVAEILRSSTVRRIRAGNILVRQGQPAEATFLLLDGQGRHFTMTKDGHKVLLIWVPPGETTGIQVLVPSLTMTYVMSTEAMMDITCLVWNRSVLQGFAKRYPRLVENALVMASSIVSKFRDMHVSLTSDTACKRLVCSLEKAAHAMGMRTPEGIEVRIQHSDLASSSNLTVFTVSRFLSEWQRRGLLIKGRGRIIVPSMDELLKELILYVCKQ